MSLFGESSKCYIPLGRVDQSTYSTTMDREAIFSYHVGVAAEAYAAALFARCGLDVSVQYGADQPEYDLIVATGDRMLKVSVKGSKDGVGD